MRLTDLLTWTPAARPVLYHDIAKHQTAFSSPNGPPWHVTAYRHCVGKEHQPSKPRRDESGKRPVMPAVCPTGTHAARVPLRPFRGRVPAGSNQTNTWI